MLRSLILPAVLLASQAMALNFTFTYVAGFVQDDPNRVEADLAAHPGDLNALRQVLHGLGREFLGRK